MHCSKGHAPSWAEGENRRRGFQDSQGRPRPSEVGQEGKGSKEQGKDKSQHEDRALRRHPINTISATSIAESARRQT